MTLNLILLLSGRVITTILPGNRLITSDGSNFMTSGGEYFIVQEA
jgi:hypothetical protein